jgi:deazaflavin-dependent oxidoreductase (nitroreductase family)
MEGIKMGNWNQKVINEFRAKEGRVGGHFENMTLLLLHTIGAKSGQQRINPVATIQDGDRYVIIASKGGADTHPDWYYNVVANPDVSVEVGTEKFDARAEVAPEPERTELYRKMAGRYQGFAEYEQKTERVIPVITLSRLS